MAMTMRPSPQAEGQTSAMATVHGNDRQSLSESVIKQIGAAPIFIRCGRATLTPVLEYFVFISYLVTEPPLKSDGTCDLGRQSHDMVMT
jgi:hypothetical protein